MLHAALLMQTQVPLTQLLSAEATNREFTCSWCSMKFHTMSNLRRHQTQTHAAPQLRSFPATVFSFAVNGLPQCSHCMESFSSWRHFQIHLERNVCQAMSTGQPPLPAPDNPQLHCQEQSPVMQMRHLTLMLQKPYGHELLDAINRSAWNEIANMPQATTDLSRSCVLCGAFHSRPQELNLHLKTHHGQWVPHVFTKTMQLCRSQASNSPCRFCGRRFQKSHMCPVVTQASLLLINLDSTGGRPGHIHPEIL